MTNRPLFLSLDELRSAELDAGEVTAGAAGSRPDPSDKAEPVSLPAEAVAVRGGNLRRIYLAHPLGTGPDREANREAARAWAAWAASKGHDVEASWIDRAEPVETPERRAAGMVVNFLLMADCQELWAVGGGWSPGMREERAEAERLGLRVVDLTGLGRLPPPCDGKESRQ